MISVTYDSTLYIYVRNAQNDIVALVDSKGNEVVRYTYDSWGKAKIAGSMAETLGKRNPFRYRGYYYDTETGMYYLKSRYYDPELRRFINADTVISGPQAGANLFAYCENNPVNMADYDGHAALSIPASGGWALGSIVKTIAKAIVGVAATVITGTFAGSTRSLSYNARSYSPRDVRSENTKQKTGYDDILSGIAGKFGNFKCVEASDAMLIALKSKRRHGNIVTLKVEDENEKLISTYIWSESRGMNISENGIHKGIEYKGKIYCNVHPLGLPEKAWKADFMAPVGVLQLHRIPF